MRLTPDRWDDRAVDSTGSESNPSGVTARETPERRYDRPVDGTGSAAGHG